MILMEVPVHQWRSPSQRASIYGIDDCTRFRITGRLSDGAIVWRGWFDSREDADAFFFALVVGSLHQEPGMWRLPTPQWHPDFEEGLTYDFATVVFLTSSPGSNVAYSIPSDWNSNNNTVEAIGGGGGANTASGRCKGGGGGGYSKSVNLLIAQGLSITRQVGAGGTSATPGTDGGDSWFNDTAMPASGQAVGAKGGSGANNTDDNTTPGGQAASGYATGTGNAKSSGGSGGNILFSGTNRGSGGGGAAGPVGAGANGGNDGSNVNGGGGGGNGGGSNGANGSAGSGGNGGNNQGGTGGGAGATSGSVAVAGTNGGGGGGGFDSANPFNFGANGGAGIEFTTHGSGGGGGGSVGTDTQGAGGLYGGASGGGGAGGSFSAQGLLIVTYTPLFSSFGVDSSHELTANRRRYRISGY